MPSKLYITGCLQSLEPENEVIFISGCYCLTRKAFIIFIGANLLNKTLLKQMCY